MHALFSENYHWSVPTWFLALRLAQNQVSTDEQMFFLHANSDDSESCLGVSSDHGLSPDQRGSCLWRPMQTAKSVLICVHLTDGALHIQLDPVSGTIRSRSPICAQSLHPHWCQVSTLPHPSRNGKLIVLTPFKTPCRSGMSHVLIRFWIFVPLAYPTRRAGPRF